MKNNCFSILLLLLTLLPCSLNAQAGFSPIKDAGSFRQKVASASRTTQTIESSFVQEKIMDVLSEKITSRGKFYFRKENDLRWEYTSPVKYLIIIHNGNILIRDESKESHFDARSNKLFSEINAIIVGSVKGTLFEDKTRFSSAFFENVSRYLVKMKPISSNLKATLCEIRLYIDKKDMTVSEIEMQEISGDMTRIVFQSKKINTPLPNDIFSSKK
ncbi:MAG: outer membrane lipoprotein carrier protein LolA [Bacteroidota bacterium]|nr:outer membrane lipoprotein carrier protein LolA [Bacteroidota bacterium]